MEMLSNCSNDIYNHVAFLHVSSRVNSIRVSLFFRASFNFKCARFTFPTKLKTVSTGKKFSRKVSKNPLNCLHSEMKTISPKLLGILAVKSNRIRIPSRNVFKKKIWVKFTFQEIPEYAVLFAT